jgi:hypothetical protein
MFLLLLGTTHAEGNYQLTRNGKTLVWNDHPKTGDEATWSGRRDRDRYAHGFGTLVWYTKEPGFEKPQLYARYWGNMVDGKFQGPVNVHSKKKTHHALFANGVRVTGWAPGPAKSRMSAEQIALLEKENAVVRVGKPQPEPSLIPQPRDSSAAEPEAPAAGPLEQRSQITDQRSEIADQRTASGIERVQDLWSERWPKIDLDESIRLLAFPPERLRQ